MVLRFEPSKTREMTLSEERWNAMCNRRFMPTHEAAQRIIQSIESKSESESDSRNKNVKIKPLVFYNVQDCLLDSMKRFENQAKENISIIKKNREEKGYKWLTQKDVKDAIGEFHEGKVSTSISVGSPIIFRSFIRYWAGGVCQFIISESNYGVTAKMRRRGYVLESVSVIFQRKNGPGLCKEIVLKQGFFNFPKHPSTNPVILSSKNKD